MWARVNMPTLTPVPQGLKERATNPLRGVKKSSNRRPTAPPSQAMIKVLRNHDCQG